MPEHRWLVLRLAGPLIAFGGVSIDQLGVTRDFPAVSMLTGLIANALGYRRTDWAAHQALQDRLVFAVRQDVEHSAGLLMDMQNARLGKTDKGWTTGGIPEGRDGASHSAPHRRQRYYHMDAQLTLAMRLEPADGSPDLDGLATALERPRRPIFIGRKPCLPTGQIADGFVTAADAFSALKKISASPPSRHTGTMRALWPAGEGPMDGVAVDCVIDIADLRNWRSGLHAGTRRVVEGRVSIDGDAA